MLEDGEKSRDTGRRKRVYKDGRREKEGPTMVALLDNPMGVHM